MRHAGKIGVAQGGQKGKSHAQPKHHPDRVRHQPGFMDEVVPYSIDPYSGQKLPFAV
jgi:hypothetical protein